MANILDEFLILFRTRLTGDGIQRVNKQLGQTRNSLFKTSNLFKTFFAYDMYGAIRNLIPSMIDVAKKMGAMEARFYAVTGSTKLAKEELGFVKQEADRLGLTFLETADNYSIFYASVKNTMGGDTARQIFTDWAESFRVLHIDPAKQERILYALREMSSKGKIYMQDLANQLGSHVPDAMGLAAKSMGYVGKDAVGRFRKDITAGKVDVQKFLTSFSSVVNQTYVSAEKLGNAMNKPDAQLATLANRWQSFQIAFVESGFQDDLVGILKTLNNMLPVLEKMAPAIYKILKVMLVIFGSAMLGNIAKTIANLKTITWLVEGLAWLVGGLSNPLGWISLLTVTLGFIIHKFFPNIEDSIVNTIIGVTALIYGNIMMLGNVIKNSPLGWFLRPNLSGAGGGTATDKIERGREAGDKLFPNNKTASNLFGASIMSLDFAKMLYKFSNPLDYKMNKMATQKIGPSIGKILIPITVNVPETANSPQDIGDYIRQAEEKVLNKIFGDIPNINSK